MVAGGTCLALVPHGTGTETPATPLREWDNARNWHQGHGVRAVTAVMSQEYPLGHKFPSSPDLVPPTCPGGRGQGHAGAEGGA